MSSSTGFSPLREEDVTQALTQLLGPRLQSTLMARAAGHCMRVTDLDVDLMVNVGRSLRRESPDAQIHILGKGDDPEPELFISSTKLVELRNPLPDGTQRPPLLVFLPSNFHTNAEDSFNIASFEEVSVAGAYEELVDALLARIPVSFQGYVKEILLFLTREKWPWADRVRQSRFLLTAVRNGVDEESLGASLYEVGLVPDFQLFSDPTLTLNRIRKNLEAVRALTTADQSIRGRVLALDLADKTVQRRFTEFLLETGVDDPRRWTRRIVLEKQYWDVSFDKWKFREDRAPERVLVRVLGTDLHTVQEDVTDEKLRNLVGQQVLIPNNRRNFKVEFTTEPHPQQVQGLSYFTVQIVSQEGEPLGVAKKVKAWKRGSTKAVTIDKLNNYGFEEGWHFVRVLPWTEEGDSVPLVETVEVFAGDRARPFESDLFYVLLGGSLEEEPPQRAIPQEFSLEHARLRLQFVALAQGRDPDEVRPKDVIWTDKAEEGTAQPALEIKFGREGAFRISVARGLHTIESRILQSPERLQNWHLRVGMEKASVTSEPLDLPRSAAVESFLAARVLYFQSVRMGDKDMITQGRDLADLSATCEEYASTYRDLIGDLRAKIEKTDGADQQRLISGLRAVLSIDTVRVFVADFRGRIREAAIICPTHPLRALWFSLWARVSRHWLSQAKKGLADHVGMVRESALDKLNPVNFPATLPLVDGRVFLAVDQIHPFWALYAPAREEDSRGLLSEVCSALGLAEPSIGNSSVDGEVLATRLERYIAQHPYIGTLIINAFNPGRATVLADALLWLQKREATAKLRYDIRLFVPEPESPIVGEGIEQLLSPTSNVGAEADAFSVPSGSHLFPKLNLAVHPVTDFMAQPEEYQAHITMLFDVFPAEELGVLAPFEVGNSTPVHGLIQDFARIYHDDENGTMWRQQPIHGTATPLEEAEGLVDLLSKLTSEYSGATATTAVGSPAFERLPVVTLSLDAEQRALLNNIHNASDWVFTVDRHLGIEFFDQGGGSVRPPYLVDYIPSATSSSGHQLIITSRSTAGLRATLRQTLNQYGLDADEKHAASILNALRSLSGRLALKFMSARTQQAEALGIAVAHMFLGEQGALSNQVVLPLDSHLDLFRAVKVQAAEVGEDWNLQRTDLALFDLNARERTIRCNLVEVKFYRHVGGLGDYQKLKENIARQISQSEEVLRRHFDPEWQHPDRADRLLKTRELSTLLRFYLERGHRYGLLDDVAAAEALALLAHLEEGYSLSFSRSAIIFTYDEIGGDLPEVENGIEFYRVGGGVIRELLEQGELGDVLSEPLGAQVRNTIPRLSAASFIVPERERSITWEDPARKRGDSEAVGREGMPPLSESRGSVNRQKLDPNQPANPSEVSLNETVGDPAVSSEQSRTDISPPPVTSEPIRHPIAQTATSPQFSVMLGAQADTPQYGIIGEVAGRKIALDLNQTHTISLFGIQGGGKSYTLGSIVEMTCVPIENINVLPSPLTTVIFHYSQTQDYRPEFTSMAEPNSEEEQIRALRERYGAAPQAIKDVVLLTPPGKISERQAEYPDIKVHPISFTAGELKAAHWKFLMGAVGSQSMYLKQVNLIMRKLRDTLTLPNLLRAIDDSPLSEHLKDLARTRLEFAAEYIDDDRPRLSDIVRPGRLVIVDLRDEFIDKDEALGLFVVLLQIFSEATAEGQAFNKLVVFDEAHKYIENSDLVTGLIEVVREMRHRGTSILIASQDPLSVPVPLIELSTQMVLHKFNSPAWLKHLQRANASLGDLSADKMSKLGAGEAYIWSSKATDDTFTRGAVKVKCRPRVTQHGGGTKTAIK